MLKIILFVLVVQILFGDGSLCFGEELERENHDNKSSRGELSQRNPGFNVKNGDKLHKKKYYKVPEAEKAFVHRGKTRDNQKEQGEGKKVRANGKKRFAKNERENDLANGKYLGYPSQNHYENPAKDKEVSYHDKIAVNEKRDDDERELFEDVKPVSLHHDTNVNYIGYHDREQISNDAEFINIDGNFQKDEKNKNSVDIVNENEKKRKENFYKNLKEIDLASVPASNNSALVARYILHNVDWTAIGTLAASSKIKGGPFVNIISMSDGPTKKSSGVPFFYMTPKDFSSIDLNKDNRCTITVTLAQTDFCKRNHLDPESPLCARLILSGKVKRVKPGTDEEDFAKNALFSRHPKMQKWPSDHNWYFAKLKIWQIILIDHFGGASYISIQDYFNIGNL